MMEITITNNLILHQQQPITDVEQNQTMNFSNSILHVLNFENSTDPALEYEYELFDYTNYNLTLEEQKYCQRLQNYSKYRAIMDIFLAGILIIMGFIGNTIAVFVLRSDNINKTVTFLLQSLAVTDNFYLLACLFIQPLKALSECTDWIPGLKEIFPYLEPYAWLFAAVSQTTAVWMVVLVTMDRYIAICHPFHVIRLCTLPRAKIIVGIVVLSAIFYNIPRFFEHTVITQFDYCLGVHRLVTVHSHFRRSKIYFIIYKTCMYITFRLAIPLVTLFVLNIKLFIILKEAMRNHATMTRSNVRQDSFTLILVTVVTAFLICEIPDATLRLIVLVKHFKRDFQIDGIMISYIATITNLLLTVNSSINCLIYCLTGRRFRLLLYRMLFRRCSDERKRNRQFSNCRYTYNDLSGREKMTCEPHLSNASLNGPTTNQTLQQKVDKVSYIGRETRM